MTEEPSLPFDDFKTPDLYEYARKIGIKTPFGRNRKVIRELLLENKVDEEEVRNYLNYGFSYKTKEKEEEQVAFDEVTQVLVKMTRGNSIFDFDGHRFTKKNPYALMDRKTARRLVDRYPGFVTTSPEEVKEFYS